MENNSLTLVELLAEKLDDQEFDSSLQYSVTRTPDGQTNPDE